MAKMRKSQNLVADILRTIFLLHCVNTSLSAPGRSADDVLIGQVDIALRGDNDVGNTAVEKNTIDRHAVESFSKKCFVDNKYYSHSEIIPSRNLGSHCLCVAGEVYCWWQTYGGQRVEILTSKSTTKVLMEQTEEKDADSDSETIGDDEPIFESEKNEPEASGDSSAETSDKKHDDNAGNDSNDLTDEEQEEGEDQDGDEEDQEKEEEEQEVEEEESDRSSSQLAANSTSTSRTPTAPAQSSTRAPSTCLVMGRTYQQGEVLPRLTGNCVECSCGEDSRIQCSPRDCVSLRPQIGNDVVAPGDGLELFGLERDRGLIGSF